MIISGAEQGKSSDTVLFGRIENLGIGKELGGGEFEYVGPAQSSEKTSSLKALSFLQALALILMGAVFTVVFECVLLSECIGDGVLGKEEEKHCLVTGVEQAFKGVGSIPAPDW